MGQSEFLPREYYQSSESYRFLPFQFLQFDDYRKILVNEVGEHLFLTNHEFDCLVTRQLSSLSPAYNNLKAKHFLTDSSSKLPLELLATKYRTKRADLAC